MRSFTVKSRILQSLPHSLQCKRSLGQFGLWKEHTGFPPHSAPFITGWCRETYSSYISCNCSGWRPTSRINHKRAKMNYFLTVSCLSRPCAMCVLIQHSGCLQINLFFLMNPRLTFYTAGLLSGQEAHVAISMLPVSPVANPVVTTLPVKWRRGVLFRSPCETFIPSLGLLCNCTRCQYQFHGTGLWNNSSSFT